jgi:predicted SnoaL-like aldol condensation-catalyzing enzyme
MEMTASNVSEANKPLVLAGIQGAFIDRDPAALDRLFTNGYQQHNPLIANGTAAIKAVIAGLSQRRWPTPKASFASSPRSALQHRPIAKLLPEHLRGRGMRH